MIKMKKGLFIAFEGIDGCGKSTQIWLLSKYLFELDKHNHITITREPYKDTEIRKILFEEKDPYSKAKKLAEMFIQDRRKHMKEVIIPNLKNNNHVITDRYSLSTLAYQQTQGVSLNELLEMHKGIIIPDIIFLIDVSSDIVMKRMMKDKARKSKQMFEKDKEFIEKLRTNFLDLKKLKGHNIIIIDGSKKPEEIFEKQIKPAFDKIYNSRFL